MIDIGFSNLQYLDAIPWVAYGVLCAGLVAAVMIDPWMD